MIVRATRMEKMTFVNIQQLTFLNALTSVENIQIFFLSNSRRWEGLLPKQCCNKLMVFLRYFQTVRLLLIWNFVWSFYSVFWAISQPNCFVFNLHSSARSFNWMRSDKSGVWSFTQAQPLGSRFPIRRAAFGTGVNSAQQLRSSWADNSVNVLIHPYLPRPDMEVLQGSLLLS